MVAPITIRFMIECTTTAQPGINIWPGGWDSPSGLETRAWLRDNGLIDSTERATSRGQAWLEAILKTPLPPLPEPQDVGEGHALSSKGSKVLFYDDEGNPLTIAADQATMPTVGFRWLASSSSEANLQQAHYVGNRRVWRNIPEVGP